MSNILNLKKSFSSETLDQMKRKLFEKTALKKSVSDMSVSNEIDITRKQKKVKRNSF